MIDTNKAFLAFKEKLDNMSVEERKEYLKKMGFKYSISSSKPAKKAYCSPRNRRLMNSSPKKHTYSKRPLILKRVKKAV